MNWYTSLETSTGAEFLKTVCRGSPSLHSTHDCRALAIVLPIAKEVLSYMHPHSARCHLAPAQAPVRRDLANHIVLLRSITAILDACLTLCSQATAGY